MSILLALQSSTPPAVSLAASSSTESASVETVVERLALSTATATQDSSAATIAERTSLAVASSSEASTAGSVAERTSAAVASVGETASAGTLAERLSAGVGSAAESASGSTIAERVSASIDTSAESSTAATLSPSAAPPLPVEPAGGGGGYELLGVPRRISSERIPERSSVTLSIETASETSSQARLESEELHELPPSTESDSDRAAAYDEEEELALILAAYELLLDDA